MSAHTPANPKHKRHPLRALRRERAAARAKEHRCTAQCRRFRTGRAVWSETTLST